MTKPKKPRRRADLLLIGLALLPWTGLGCGAAEEPRPEVHPVKGSITINGEPPEGALLVFHPANGAEFDERGTRPRATVEPDGQFSVTTYQDGDGIPTGSYDVTVLWFDDPDATTPHDRLGGRYATPDQAGIQVTVDESATEIAPITIDRARIVPRRGRSRTVDHDGLE